tara:strand:- start:38 stop:1717 length:1680 start_codon:yes stop_codon:yes gene_type:complete
MAVLKIPQSELRANVGQATPVSEAALPLSLAKAYGQAIGEVGKQVQKVAKDQRDINDQITLNEMVRDAVVKMEKTRAEVSLNSDLDFAVNEYDKKTKLDQFNDIYQGKNKNVQNLFRLWLAKQKNSDYALVTKAVTKQHVSKVKSDHKKSLNQFILDSANPEKAIENDELIKSWFKNPNNRKFYGEADWEELQQNLKKDIIESRLMFGVKNHPRFTIANEEKIKELVGADKVRQVVEDATKKIASDVQFNVSREKALDKFDEDNKIATFAEIALRIKNDTTPETLGNIPTLDFLNDLFQDDKINSAQYDALIRFMSNPEDLVGSDQVMDEIRAQMFAAETVEDVDRLNRIVNLNSEVLQGLGIDDYKTIGALIEKNKDRQGFEQYKYYGTLIDKILGKVDNVALRDGTDTVKQEALFRSVGAKLYDGYVAEGDTPQQAFTRIVDGYLSNKNKLPTIYDISRVQSFNLKVPSDAEYKDKGSAGIFNGWRSTVFDKYKKGEINIDTLMSDIDSLSVMEEVYEARKIVEDANAGNGAFVSGVGFGFFENNTVLDPLNKGPKN